MSLKTTISNQIQMIHTKNHRNDQKTWPVPNSAANITLTSLSAPP